MTQATSSLMGQSWQQGGDQTVVMGRHQLLKSDMGDQVSHGQGAKGWAAGPDTVWTNITAQGSEAR